MCIFPYGLKFRDDRGKPLHIYGHERCKDVLLLFFPVPSASSALRTRAQLVRSKEQSVEIIYVGILIYGGWGWLGVFRALMGPRRHSALVAVPEITAFHLDMHVGARVNIELACLPLML
ncbi:hypothetical protein C8J57DRAFT_1212773 [Mycena rebaudengoi]|nr:hypothetical protein C8J57DRAFT_1212773 [Mycena rebaudengoi]